MDVKPEGPLQAKDAFAAFVPTEICTVGFAQVIVAPVVTAEGGSVLPVTETEEVPVQPFAGFVTVTVYIPGSDASGLGIFVALRPLGGDQLKVGLGAFVVVVNCACALPQPRKPPVAVTVGWMKSAVTVMVS